MDYDSKFKERKTYLEVENKYLKIIEELKERLSSNTLFIIGDYYRGIIDIEFTIQYKKLILKLFLLSNIFDKYMFKEFEDSILININEDFLRYVTKCIHCDLLITILMEIDKNDF